MSSLTNEPEISQDSASLALLPDKQKNQLETPKLTPSQQRKRDALDMAELIYNIYNKDCPASSKGSVGKENENV